MMWWHLWKRFIGSLTARPLSAGEQREVDAVLLPVERPLFGGMTRADKRHAVQVLRRFDIFQPSARPEERRAALLHDIGKAELGLGTLGRVVATLFGPRSDRFARYHAHESRGAELLARAGSHETTVNLLRGLGNAETIDALRRADDV